MAPVYKVAVIQLYPKPMQVEENYEKAEQFIRAAAAQGAHLAVLPEYHLTNWRPEHPKFGEVCADWQKYLNKYKILAKECNMCIVPGTIVQTKEGVERSKETVKLIEGATQPIIMHTAENYLENVAYFIDNKGEILSQYVKKNLWGPVERSHLASSMHDSHPCFDTPIGKVGMLICWDLAFPEAFRELIYQGAKTIIIPTFWTLADCNEAGLKLNPSSEAVFIDSILPARCFENTCAVVFANAAGPPEEGYMGLSQVCVPFIGALTKLETCAEGMRVVDLDMQIMEDAEANYQVRFDLASDGWHYDYRHDNNDETKGWRQEP